MSELVVVNADATLKAMEDVSAILEEIKEKSTTLLRMYSEVGEKTNLNYVNSLKEFSEGMLKQIEDVASHVEQVRVATNDYLQKTEDLDSVDKSIYDEH